MLSSKFHLLFGEVLLMNLVMRSPAILHESHRGSRDLVQHLCTDPQAFRRAYQVIQMRRSQCFEWTANRSVKGITYL